VVCEGRDFFLVSVWFLCACDRGVEGGYENLTVKREKTMEETISFEEVRNVATGLGGGQQQRQIVCIHVVTSLTRREKEGMYDRDICVPYSTSIYTIIIKAITVFHVATNELAYRDRQGIDGMP